MKTIDFKYYMNLQARFISYISKKLNISHVEAATLYCSLLRSKITSKYVVCNSDELASFE